MYECCVSAHVSYNAYKSQKKVSDPLEQELQMVVSCMWALKIEPTCFARETSALKD